ncbi:MAG: phosphodiester glycosidase family protein, partial [Propionibacteriaceae bacterium]|nr:phosphodiester glycosidase family protein [Propionibacteriaceae bacterium]
TYGENIIEEPSAIAQRVGATLAINGDYYGFRSEGIVIRNGIAFRDEGARDGLALYSDGQLKVYAETATDAQQLVDDGVWQAWSFGPGLIIDGQIQDGIDDVEVDTNVGNHSIQGQQPRTGIAMIEPNHYLFVVVDGRAEGYSVGVTMSEFAELFAGLGAQVAYNLDGGGSSTMVYHNDLVNNPRGEGKERGTSDIIWTTGT